MPKYSVPYTLQKPKTWYFLIGVNYSPGCGLSELKYSARDCQTLEKIFRDEIKPVPSELEFLVFHDDDSSSLPTRDKILETWKHIQVQSNDTVIFYFSGHGKLDETIAQFCV